MESTKHRIVFVAGGIKLGGATTFLLNLAGELVRRRIPVLVVSLEHDNPYASDFEELGIPVHIEDERTSIFEDRLSSALKVVHQFDPTAVIACLGPSSYEILRYVPASVTRLGMLQSDCADSYSIVALYASFFDGTIGVSRQIEANFRAHPLLGVLPVHYLPYGVAIPNDDAQRARQPGEAIRLLYFGRLCRSQKRVHLFPAILRGLNASGVSFQWTIAGDGPERSWLEKEMISSRSVTIKFPGPIRYRDVPRLLDFHDVFLLVSDEEGLPLSLLEAMAHGLVPVVSNLSSGVSEVVNEQSGVLVELNDIDGYAAGIIRLSQDPSAFSAMSKSARERARANYSVEAMTDRWLSVLKPGEKPVSWPSRFDMRGPMTDSQQWKYAPVVRFFRRLLKRLKFAALILCPVIAS